MLSRRAGASVVDGLGGADGLVLSLQLQTSSAYEAVYTISVVIGDSSNVYSLQVDTGSSDLWIASSSCSSSACSSVGGGNLYDPSSATPTDSNFNITYLQGSVTGPIVWDQVGVGSYTINNQALAAATVVNNEPLTSGFQGILGLALPLNSVIAQKIPPVTGNTPDGAAWASNLFSLTPVSAAPAAHFLSLSLERPGSDRIPSLLGIGHHPSSLIPDPSKIHYYSLVGNNVGIIYWKVTVRAITVYVNNEPRPVDIDYLSSGQEYPTAVLDSGVPVILTTPDIANGIYGAIGIGPASDGNYYVPCTTPLNMTITLANGPEISLHPLDLTSEPTGNNRAEYCVGMIQASSALSDPYSGIGDMILGVPFLRNTYTVMGYDTPFPNGSFPITSPSSSSSPPSSQNSPLAHSPEDDIIQPSLGLLGLTNTTIAMDEFQTVRVLNQPLSSGNQTNSPNSQIITVGPKKLSVGIIVLVALVGFFSLCFGLFGVRWLLLRKRYGRGGRGEGEGEGGEAGGGGDEGPGREKIEMGVLDVGGGDGESERSLVGPPGLDSLKNGSYVAIDVASRLSDEEKDPDGVVPRLRTGTLQSGDRVVSEYTASSGRTRVGADDLGEFGFPAMPKVEFNKDSFGSMGSRWSLADDPLFRRSIRVSEGGAGQGLSQHPQQAHERNPSLSIPLLAQQHRHSQSLDADEGLLPPEDAYGDRDNPLFAQEFGFRQSWPAQTADGKSGDGLNPNNDSMAGVGTARARLTQFESLEFPRDSLFGATATTTSGEWIPSYSPRPPQQVDIIEESREGDDEREDRQDAEIREEQREEQQQGQQDSPPSPPSPSIEPLPTPPLPPPPPPSLAVTQATPAHIPSIPTPAFISSGAGHPVYPRAPSTPALESESDPYAESMTR